MKEGWQIKKLGDVADVYDGPHATPTTVDSGPIFLGIGALQDGEINLGETRHVTHQDFIQWTRRVCPQANDVVFSYETRLGQAAIIPDGLVCCLGRRMGLIRFNNGTVFPRYFLYQYLSPQFREFLESKTIRGATVDRLSIKDFPSFPILLPPLSEQERIVALLDEAFAGLAIAKANAEQNLQNARALFESDLQSVFSQRGEGWEERALGSVCSIARGGSPRPISEYITTEPGGINWIKISDATSSGKYIFKTAQAIKPEGVSRSRMVNDGDFLLSNSMSFGRPSIMRTSGCIHDGWLMLTDYAGSLTQDYLYYLLGSQLVYRQFDSLAAGSTVRNLNIELASRVILPVPPLEVQKIIAKEIEALAVETQRLTRLYERKLAALEELKKSLLHQAFNGEL